MCSRRFVTICTLIASFASALAPAAAANGPSSVPAAAVPLLVKQTFANEFSLHGDVLVPKSYVCGEGDHVEYGKILGWYHAKGAVGDADSANGIRSSDLYQVRVKIYRKNALPWASIAMDPAAADSIGPNGGAIFDVLYERTTGEPKVVSVLNSLCGGF